MRCAQRPVGRAALSPYRAHNSLAPLCRTCTANTKLPIKTPTLHFTVTKVTLKVHNIYYYSLLFNVYLLLCVFLCTIPCQWVELYRMSTVLFTSMCILICIVNIAVTLCRCRLCNFIMMFYAVLLYYLLMKEAINYKEKAYHSYMVLSIFFVTYYCWQINK